MPVWVPSRLAKLADIVVPKRIIPTTIEFVDIAGLVAGASKGEGLGNQFLGNIREADAIVHVVRCFENDDIVHVSGRIKPLDDIEVINTELLLADLATVEKALQKAAKVSKSGNKEEIAKKEFFDAANVHLDSGKPARTMDLSKEGKLMLRDLPESRCNNRSGELSVLHHRSQCGCGSCSRFTSS